MNKVLSLLLLTITLSSCSKQVTTNPCGTQQHIVIGNSVLLRANKSNCDTQYKRAPGGFAYNPKTNNCYVFIRFNDGDWFSKDIDITFCKEAGIANAN